MINELDLIKNFAKTDELQSLACFITAVNSGTFAQAGIEIGISKFVVRRRIKALEDMLGVTLLFRSQKGVSLTAEGKRYYDQGLITLISAVQARNSVTSNSNEPTGVLNISIPALLAEHSITSRITRFTHAYPKVKLIINYSDEPMDLISETLDAVIRIGDLEDSSMTVQKLFYIGRMLVATPSFIVKHKIMDKTPEELQSLNWIGVKMLPHCRTLIHYTGRKIKLAYEPSILVNFIWGGYQLARAGAGLFTPPDYWTSRDLKNNILVKVFPEYEVEPLPVYFIRHTDSKKFELLSLFKNFLITD